MQDFKKLDVWRKAHELTLLVYRSTIGFPDNEKYGLVSQMRRSAASIPMNITEGCGRNGGNDLARFLDIAAGSSNELEYQSILCKDLGLFPDSIFETLNNRTLEIQRMLAGLLRKIRTEK